MALKQQMSHSPNDSQLQTSLEELKAKLYALEQSQGVAHVDGLVKQTLLVTTNVLETRLAKMRRELQKDSSRETDKENSAKLEQFEKYLKDLRLLMEVQRSEIDSKVRSC